jgi:hypothetical protein
LTAARRTRTQRRFSALPRRSASHFPAISNDFGGIAFRFSQDAPTDAPTLIWAAPEPSWTSLDDKILPFDGFSRGFPRFLDVCGRRRKSMEVDGWPPNCQAKSLFLKVFYFSVCEDAPSNRWLPPDVGGHLLSTLVVGCATMLPNSQSAAFAAPSPPPKIDLDAFDALKKTMALPNAGIQPSHAKKLSLELAVLDRGAVGQDRPARSGRSVQPATASVDIEIMNHQHVSKCWSFPGASRAFSECGARWEGDHC